MENTTRRRFLRDSAILSGAAIVAACSPGPSGPTRPQRIGYLSVAGSHSVPYFESFRRGLQDHGLVEGRDVTIEYRFAEKHDDAELRGLARELVDLPVDLILARCSPETRAAKAVTSTVPIVMIALTGDPVSNGVVETLSHPNGNVTGLTVLAPTLSGKRVDLLREAFPKTARLGVLLNTSIPENAEDLAQMRTAAGVIGVDIQTLPVSGADRIDDAFAPAKLRGLDALTTLMGSLGTAQRARIVALQTGTGLPALYEVREFVEIGGLMSYGPSLRELYARAADYVARILRGTQPAALPVERPGRFELVVNRKAARSLGVTFPDSILAQAGDAID